MKNKWNYYNKKKKYTKPKLNKGIIEQNPNTWVKRSPIFNGPPSPKLGYEGSNDYDVKNKKLIHHGGHNQGGGGTQGFETWIYDLVKGTWILMYPNTSPPGNCCSRTNVMDQANGKFIRFPGFSGHHGWQWSRRIFNLDSSVWAYDLNKNKWVNMCPIPEISVGPARAAAYDTDNQIILVFNVYESSKTAAYDLYTNTWTLLYPKNEPPKKPSYNPGFNMIYDQSQKLFVLFGVGDGTDPRTFTFDIKKNEWKDMQPEINPTYYKADPVLAYDSKNKVTICVVANKEKNCLETWAYNSKSNQWEKRNPAKEPDFSVDRKRILIYSPDQNLLILENRTKTGNWRTDEQQIWTYRYAETQEEKIPEAPEDLKLKTTDNNVELSWKSRSKNYNIYHGVSEKPWLVNYKKIASVKTNKFIHKNQEKDKINYYYVTVVDSKESKPSLKVRAQPRVITDIVISALSKDKVEIEWKTNDKDIAGYNIYRAETEFQGEFLRSIFPFKKINNGLVKNNNFIDNVLLNKVHAYRIHAVNNLGIESGPSPFILTIPSPPQYVFSKENGNDCQLKWQKNPEKSVVGYNVYRTRYSKFDDEHDLLNKEPIKATNFTDINAKKGMPTEPSNTGRRYYITAVDFLGQESFPSAPVWFYREWHKFYKLGVWHQ